MSNDNTLDSLFFNKLSYREIYTLKDQGNLKYDYVIKREKSFVIKDEEENIYTFFLNPTSVNFQNVFINNKRQNREIKTVLTIFMELKKIIINFFYINVIFIHQSR